MSPLRMTYLALALWGAFHPMSRLLVWIQENGWGLDGLIGARHANAAASGLVWDLTISAIVLTVWVLAETRVRRNWSALSAIPATFLVGVSFGLPLYLFLRTRPVT